MILHHEKSMRFGWKEKAAKKLYEELQNKGIKDVVLSSVADPLNAGHCNYTVLWNENKED